jgi:predicted DNA-binding transcriptional regulator AlpA
MAAEPIPPPICPLPAAPTPAPSVKALLLSAAQAAILCGLSPATWYRMGSAGRCPAPPRLSRGCVRWRTEELRDWIAGGCPDRRTWEALGRAKGGGR